MKISAKFRRKNSVPFAIERLSGVQFRCRVCNMLYYSKKELERHLKKHEGKSQKRDQGVPALDHLTTVKVLYTIDLYDRGRCAYLKLPEGEEYDRP